MPDLRLGAKVEPAPRTLFRVLGSRSLLLELERGLYFGLDEVATTIWQAFEHRLSLGQTLDLLEARYDEERNRLHEDLMTFVQESLDAQLIRRVS